MRLITLILAFLFLNISSFSLLAGGNGDDEKKKNAKKQTSEQTQKNSETTEEESTEEDDSEEHFEEETDEEYDGDSDTLSLYSSVNNRGWTYNDSVANIPAYELYCTWNTKVVHPYKFDLTKKNDTTVIFLQDEAGCDYYHPFEGDITSNFGPRKGRYHYGIDIKLQIGDSVGAAFEGTVRIAQKSKTYGNVVVLRHNNGLETLYAHLDKIIVNVDDHLEAGDVLGLGGNTGRSSGSHLHFEVRFKGAPINPNDIISFEDYKLKMDVLALNKSHFNYLIKAKAEAKKIKYHKVRKGDTLSKISRRYGVSVKKICKLNRIRTTTTLKIGRKIRIS